MNQTYQEKNTTVKTCQKLPEMVRYRKYIVLMNLVRGDLGDGCGRIELGSLKGQGDLQWNGVHFWNTCMSHARFICFFIFLQMSGPFHKFSNSVSNNIKIYKILKHFKKKNPKHSQPTLFLSHASTPAMKATLQDICHLGVYGSCVVPPQLRDLKKTNQSCI